MKRAPAEACPLTDARLATIARHKLSAPMVDMLALLRLGGGGKVALAAGPVLTALERRGLVEPWPGRPFFQYTDAGLMCCNALFGAAPPVVVND